MKKKKKLRKEHRVIYPFKTDKWKQYSSWQNTGDQPLSSFSSKPKQWRVRLLPRARISTGTVLHLSTDCCICYSRDQKAPKRRFKQTYHKFRRRLRSPAACMVHYTDAHCLFSSDRPLDRPCRDNELCTKTRLQFIESHNLRLQLWVAILIK